MNSRHGGLETSVTRWTAIAVGIVLLTMLLAAMGPEFGRQTYIGGSEIRPPPMAASVARDRPAIDQQGASDTSVPSAQAVFEHSPAVPEGLPLTF
jgi:hypothetical protein